MIFTLLLIIAVIVMVAMFIGKNLTYSTPIWLFKTFEETNVVVIVFLAFAAGMVFAILCILLRKIIQSTKSAEGKENVLDEAKTSKDSVVLQKNADSKEKSEKTGGFLKKSKKSKKSENDEKSVGSADYANNSENQPGTGVNTGADNE